MRHLLSRLLATIGVMLAAISLAELALAGVRQLRAERPRPTVHMEVPENYWSALREMGEQAKAMGLW
jgi:hypothetical protein